jgi:hypothetical protein
MKYADGQDVRAGDVVQLGRHKPGVVVCLLDTATSVKGFPVAQWRYLATGILVDFPEFGVIHYTQPESDLRLVARDGAP